MFFFTSSIFFFFSPSFPPPPNRPIILMSIYTEPLIVSGVFLHSSWQLHLHYPLGQHVHYQSSCPNHNDPSPPHPPTPRPNLIAASCPTTDTPQICSFLVSTKNSTVSSDTSGPIGQNSFLSHIRHQTLASTYYPQLVSRTTRSSPSLSTDSDG